jgi:hypothetical protein
LRSELRRVVLLAPLLLTRSPRDITAKLEAISGVRGAQGLQQCHTMSHKTGVGSVWAL